MPVSLGNAKLMYFLIFGSEDDIATIASPDGDDSKKRKDYINYISLTKKKNKSKKYSNMNKISNYR